MNKKEMTTENTILNSPLDSKFVISSILQLGKWTPHPFGDVLGSQRSIGVLPLLWLWRYLDCLEPATAMQITTGKGFVCVQRKLRLCSQKVVNVRKKSCWMKRGFTELEYFGGQNPGILAWWFQAGFDNDYLCKSWCPLVVKYGNSK